MAADIRSFFRRLPGLFRNDFAAVMLVIANVLPVVNILWKGEPISSILVIYWIQMMIIGFWTIIKLIVIARWAALVYVPMFLLMYLAIVNLFGLMAGGLLVDQIRETPWHQAFSPWDYWLPGLLFFATHGLSFFENFIGGREFENIKPEAQMGKPILRAMPMWIALVVGAIVGSFFHSAAVVVLFVLPVKLAFDVLGHFHEHGMLAFDEVESEPVQS